MTKLTPMTDADSPASEAGIRPTQPGVSRRGWLRAATGAAAFWGSASALQRPVRAADVSADVDPGALLNKLVQRMTFGPSAEELALAASLGYAGYLEHHLNPAAIDDGAVEATLTALTTLTMLPYQLYGQSSGTVSGQLIEARLRRATFSKRQLFERMVEFWSDHFSIDIFNGDDEFLKTVDDRDVIRPNALSTFPQILSASAHSPAMLYYLNNNLSVVGNPNENYSRELMELHTMGVDGGYTQQDVVEVARCFTGWSLYNRSSSNPQAGTFRYVSANHDNGQKTVLGNIIPAGGGMQDGITVLNILANHPSTARFIARKLVHRLLGENVSTRVVDDVAATYTATGGDIKAMLRTVFKPGYLFDAPPKYKRPMHAYVSALRALPVTMTTVSGLRTQLTTAGHVPFAWGPPDGYPDTLAHWSGFVLPRWNFGASLMNSAISGLSVDSTGFFTGFTTAQQTIDKIDQALFQGEMPADQKARIRQYLLPDPPNPTSTERREALGLAIGSPAFQWF